MNTIKCFLFSILIIYVQALPSNQFARTFSESDPVTKEFIPGTDDYESVISDMGELINSGSAQNGFYSEFSTDPESSTTKFVDRETSVFDSYTLGSTEDGDSETSELNLRSNLSNDNLALDASSEKEGSTANGLDSHPTSNDSSLGSDTSAFVTTANIDLVTSLADNDNSVATSNPSVRSASGTLLDTKEDKHALEIGFERNSPEIFKSNGDDSNTNMKDMLNISELGSGFHLSRSYSPDELGRQETDAPTVAVTTEVVTVTETTTAKKSSAYVLVPATSLLFHLVFVSSVSYIVLLR